MQRLVQPDIYLDLRIKTSSAERAATASTKYIHIIGEKLKVVIKPLCSVKQPSDLHLDQKLMQRKTKTEISKQNTFISNLSTANTTISFPVSKALKVK